MSRNKSFANGFGTAFGALLAVPFAIISWGLVLVVGFLAFVGVLSVVF